MPIIHRSPSPKTPSKEDLERGILFCIKNISNHKESENKRMILVEEDRMKELKIQLSKFK